MGISESAERLFSWELLAALLVLVYLFKNRLLSKTERAQDGSTGHGTENGVVEPRNFVQRMEEDHKNCIIFFGSQTGTAESYAIRLAKEGKARFGLETMAANIEDYDFDNLDDFPQDNVAFFILASYGEGEPTDNAAAFYKFITGTEPSFSAGSSLTNLNYVAFGLGNKTYEHYNAVVRRVTKSLDNLGASRVSDVGEGDEGSGTTEEDFLAWKETMWTALASKMNLSETETTYQPSFNVVESKDLSQESPQVYLGEPNEAHLSGGLKAVHGPFNNHNPYLAPISTSRELISAEGKDRRCIHVDVDISGIGLVYGTGDHLAVWPSNPSNEVDRLLDVLGLQEKKHQVIDVKNLDPAVQVPFPTPTTYDAMMRYYLEICAPVSRQLLADIVPFAPNETTKEKIANISNDRDLFHSETHFSNLAQFLRRVGNGEKWSRIPPSLLMEGLPKLQHRFYSISSSSLVQPTTISITVAVKSETVPDRKDPEPFCGVASNFLLALHHARLGKSRTRAAKSSLSYDILGPRGRYAGERLPVNIRHSSFKLPTDPLRPVIMIGPGTGVAPFRGFVQERAAMASQGKTVGEMLLFFGCRRRNEDFLYEQEWKVSYCRWMTRRVNQEILITRLARNTKSRLAESSSSSRHFHARRQKRRTCSIGSNRLGPRSTASCSRKLPYTSAATQPGWPRT